ncbi:MAG TPA: serine/threonine protein kinase, partial [Planctomycetaceae bacterium]|nr:serine/threonine protein kinase [Planctomycetaceae bacterium]
MDFFGRLFGKRPKRQRLPKTDIEKRFALIARVGQGSMSKVWKARDSKTGLIVALKVLDKEKTQKLEARFRGLNRPSEGEIAVQLRHPHIVRTYEHGLTRNNEQFLVMEFIDGV